MNPKDSVQILRQNVESSDFIIINGMPENNRVIKTKEDNPT